MADQKKDDKPAASAAAAGTSNANANNVQPQKEMPSLGALDEDDEFEEFEAQGEREMAMRRSILGAHPTVLVDWDDSETSLAHLNTEGGATGLSISGERGGTGDHLWEDNWDDDDVEDDFGKALR